MIDKTFPIAEKLVNNSNTLTAQLHQLLLDEAECLKHGAPIDTLNALVAKKQPIITEINQFSRQLSQILTVENLPNNQSGVQEYFDKAQITGLATETIRRQWSEITRNAKACQRLNEQNGAVIDMLQRHTQRSLNILKGKPLVADTYGKDGSAKTARYSRELISV